MACIPLRLSLFAVLALVASLGMPLAGIWQSTTAFAATYRNLVAQVPASPYASDTVHVWVNSDTAFGETAALEYRIGSAYTQVNCTYDTSYNGADWRCDIPAQSAGTMVSYQLFTYNQSNQPYGYTGFNWQYTVQADNNIHWNGLFADQSPFFMSPAQPTQGGNLTIRFRTQHSDISSVNLEWYDSGNGWNNSIPMSIVGQDATGGFDVWQTDASALLSTSATKYYRFQAIQGNATTYYNANGPTCGGSPYTQQTCQAPTGENFWVIPGFSTPAWSQSAIFYQIFPDRFRNGDPSNDLGFKASSEQDPSCPNAGWVYDPNQSLCYDPNNPSSTGPANPCPSGSYLYGGTCAYVHASWNELPQQNGRGADVFGGDLAGITREIDPYLKQTLGVNALYLNPIFESPSNHKYDTQDYYTVDPRFGTNQGSGPGSLTSLVGTAHSSSNYSGDQRMSVMLDGVFNHTGDWNCWFNRPGNACGGTPGAWQQASGQGTSPTYNFYNFNNASDPTSYCAWAGAGSLPQLNYSTPAVRDAIYAQPDSVMQTYITKYNIDGWRLDVADNYSDMGTSPSACTIGNDNHQIWQQIRPDVKAANPNALILGEYWQKPTDWLGGDQWDSVMNYNGFATPVSRFFTGQQVHGSVYCGGACDPAEPSPGSFSFLSPSSMASWLQGTLADNNRSSQLSMLNSLGTHDTSRFLYRACTGLQTTTGAQCATQATIPQAAFNKLKIATELQMTYVGMPSIYYGDEIGTTGANDPDNRRTFDWNTANWNTDVLNTTRTLIANRQAHPAFQNGTFQVLLTDDTNDVLAYGRALYDPSTIQGNGQNTVAPSDAGIAVLNNDANSHQETIAASQLSLADGTQLTDILTGNTYTVQNGQISITLAGNTGAVLVTGAAAQPPTLALPGTPTNASVQRNGGEATLTWDAPPSGGPVYGYNVSPSPSSGLTVGPINCASAASPICSVTVSGIDANTPYSFGVSAYNVSGAGSAATVNLGTVPASSLDVSVSSTATAGTAMTVTVTARNSQNGVVTGYGGPIHFSSSDAAAGLPSDYTFKNTDAGTRQFSVTLKTAGPQTLTIADSSNSLSTVSSISVAPAPASKLVASAPGTATAGSAFDVQVQAFDPYGNVASGYTGTVTLSGGGSGATLPGPHTYASGDGGTYTFTGVALTAAGNQTIAVGDDSSPSLTTSTGTISVSPAGASALQLSAPSTATAGSPATVTVTALDPYGNVATGYGGTVHFSSSDASATLPSDYPFGQSDAGSRQFSVTLTATGSQSISVADAAHALSANAPISVSAGTATHLVASAPDSATAGTPFAVTVTAYDANGNVATDYTGTVSLSGGGAGASLPGSHHFSSSDGGAYTFSGVTLTSAGQQELSAGDGALTTSTGSISVAPGSATQVTLQVPSTATAGSPVSAVVTLEDQYGNVATGYTGQMKLASSDGKAGLPAAHTFTSGDAGTFTFPVTLKTAGNQNVTATDTGNSSLTLTSGPVAVAPASASQLQEQIPAGGTAGTPINATVTLLDAYGNAATGYAGTVHFTSSDAGASLPSDYTFTSADAGSHQFSVTLTTAGNQSVSVADAANSLSTTAPIAVSAGPAAHLIVTGPGTATAGTAFAVKVTAYDASGNLATGYIGTVKLTSSDGKAVLPAAHAFTSGDAGTYSFTVTLNTAGTDSITAADTAAPSILGMTSVSVSSVPGAPAALLAVPSDRGASISWAAPATNGNSSITGYAVSCQPACPPPALSGNSATLSGLVNGTPYTVRVTAINAIGSSTATVTTVTATSLTVRYSNPLSFSASARDSSGHALAVTESGALPAGLAVSGGSTGTTTVSGTVSAPAGSFPISFSAAGLSLPATIVVTPEFAIVTFVSTNPHALQVSGQATTAAVTMSATLTDNPDGHPGIMMRALPVTFALQPVGGGTAQTCTATTGTGSGSTLVVRCTFRAGFTVGAYDLHVTPSGAFYTGSGDSALAIYNPSNGGASGGGTVISPVTHVPADVAISVRHNGSAVQGGFVYVEHRTTGDVVVESTSLSGLTITSGHGVLPRTATIAGRGTRNGTTAVSFTITAVDRSDPDSAAAPDQFQLKTADGGGAAIPDLSYGASVSMPGTSGNLFVGTA